MPDWVGPVADYMFHEGLKNTLRIALYAVLGSTLVGIVLGTLMTVRFLPLPLRVGWRCIDFKHGHFFACSCPSSWGCPWS